MVKILEQNAGLLLNAEVVQVLKDRGVSGLVSARACPSEKMVYMYLMEQGSSAAKTPAQLQEFVKDVAEFKLTKAEVMQLINLAPFSVVEVHLIVEDCEDRLSEEQVEAVLAVVGKHLR